jgi:hypothetical protein
MNERIKELAEQVDKEFNSPYDRDKAIERFALLIVRECQKLNSKELSITAIERLLPLYREHFGIEE